MATTENEPVWLIFPAPVLSLKVVRDLWMDRFVNALLMDEKGQLPEGTEWCRVHPDSVSDDFPELPLDYWEYVVVRGPEEALVDAYVAFIEHTLRNLDEEAEYDEELYPAVLYEPDEKDRDYHQWNENPLENLLAYQERSAAEDEERETADAQSV